MEDGYPLLEVPDKRWVVHPMRQAEVPIIENPSLFPRLKLCAFFNEVIERFGKLASSGTPTHPRCILLGVLARLLVSVAGRFSVTDTSFKRNDRWIACPKALQSYIRTPTTRRRSDRIKLFSKGALDPTRQGTSRHYL